MKKDLRNILITKFSVKMPTKSAKILPATTTGLMKKLLFSMSKSENISWTTSKGSNNYSERNEMEKEGMKSAYKWKETAKATLTLYGHWIN